MTTGRERGMMEELPRLNICVITITRVVVMHWYVNYFRYAYIIQSVSETLRITRIVHGYTLDE